MNEEWVDHLYIKDSPIQFDYRKINNRLVCAKCGDYFPCPTLFKHQGEMCYLQGSDYSMRIEWRGREHVVVFTPQVF